MRMQLNAPFGKIILICSQRLTRHSSQEMEELEKGWDPLLCAPVADNELVKATSSYWNSKRE